MELKDRCQLLGRVAEQVVFEVVWRSTEGARLERTQGSFDGRVACELIVHPGMALVDVSKILVRKLRPTKVVPFVLKEVGDLHAVIY